MFVEEKTANNRKDLLTSGIRFLKDLVATGIVLNGSSNKLKHTEHRTKYDDERKDTAARPKSVCCTLYLNPVVGHKWDVTGINQTHRLLNWWMCVCD